MLCVLVPAYPQAKLQVAIGEVQLNDENGPKTDPRLNALIDTARDTFMQLYADRVELAGPGKQAKGVPLVSILAFVSADAPSTTFTIIKGKQEYRRTILKPFHLIDAKTIAATWFFLVNELDGYSLYKGKNLPVLVDRMDVSQVQAPESMTQPYAYSVVSRNNGNLLIGMIGVIAELDPFGRLVDFWGRNLLAESNYDFTYDLKLSPSGTLFTKGAAASTVYAFSSSREAPRRINTGVDQAMGITVLDDGSFALKGMMSPKVVRFEGRKKNELDIVDPAYPWVQFAAGPDSTIRVFEPIGSSVKVFDKAGKLIDTVIIIAPESIVQQTMRFISLPDGSMLFQGQEFLARIDRNGIPVWFADKANNPELGDNSGAMSVAFDPKTASIYLTKSTGREVIRLIDTAWAKANKIDYQSFAPLIKATTTLYKDPEDWDALQAKVDWYDKHGAVDLAVAMLKRMVDIDNGDPTVNARYTDLRVKRLMANAETIKLDVMNTLRTIGPESARLNYMNTLKLYEQILALDPGNKLALKSRNELMAAMKQAEQAPQERPVPPLTVVSARMDNLFPALSATYRAKPFGSLVLLNDSDTETKNVTVSLYIPRFMDFPGELPAITAIKPGDKVELPLTALFNQEALKVEEDLPVQAQLTVKWDARGQAQSLQKTVSATLYRRTSLTWDLSGKLASFMTPNEESVNSFALRCLDQAKGMSAAEASLGSFSQKVWRASVIADSLGAYGIAYLEDPQSPISKTLGKAESVDTVRFPRTTLYYKNGDCDDSTALLGSLLEAAGIQTAIMTSPGHVFLAFDTGEPAESAWVFGDPKTGACIIRNKTVWLPIETTDLKNGFRHAWQTAAKLVAQHLGSPDLEMVPVHEQWSSFPSIPLPQSPYQIILPGTQPQKALLAADGTQLLASLYDQTVTAAQAQLPTSGKQRLSQLNRIGILHARFGATEKAIGLFQQAQREDKSHLSAYINLGNLYLQGGKSADAVSVLLQAKALRPESSSVQLMLAQAYYALGDTAKTQEAWIALEAGSKELASQYSWLSKTAGDASQRTSVERASNAASPVKPVWNDSGE
jgi:tetratricopeptide (TPR) repeat protein